MAENYLYWISTTLLSLLYLASATMHILKRGSVRQALAELGYPSYLVPILIAVKIASHVGAAALRKLVDSALSSYGRLDVAFNNAGTEGIMRPITELHEQDWTRTIDVNLKGRGPGVGRQPSASVCSRFVVHSTLAIGCRCA